MGGVSGGLASSQCATMGEWLVQITGTPEGARLATMLALMSAIAHAAFGALQKGCHDPWLSRGANYGWLFIISALVTLFLVSLPTLQVAWLLAGALVIHFGYKVTMALSYERAAYTVVYPIVRGTGPLVTVLAASVMLATRSNKVGEAAVLRETSTVFAALIAWLILGEHVGKRRAALMALVALGAVIVEMGG